MCVTAQAHILVFGIDTPQSAYSMHTQREEYATVYSVLVFVILHFRTLLAVNAKACLNSNKNMQIIFPVFYYVTF